MIKFVQCVSVPRFLFLLFSTLWLGLLCPQTSFAQSDNDVAHWLDRDTAAVLNVSDMPTTVDRISELDLFSNPRFLKAIEMLSDERFPIVKADEAPVVWDKLDGLKELVKRFPQVTFVLHQYDESNFSWSLFLRADEEGLESLKKSVVELDEFAKSSISYETPAKSPYVLSLSGNELLEFGLIEPDTDEKKKSETDDQPGKSNGSKDGDTKKPGNATDLGWASYMRVGKWFVLSNNVDFLDALPDRIKDKKFRSLAKSRKYRAIGLRKSPLNKKDGLITIYAMPLQMRQFFPRESADTWKLLKIKELPSCGINLVIAKQEDESNKSAQPIILADAVVKYTQPAEGYAKRFEYYSGFEIPPLVEEPIELIAYSRDEAKCVEVAIKEYDAEYGEGAAEKWWKDLFTTPGLDLYKDAIPRRDSIFKLRFVDGQDHTMYRPGTLTLEGVSEPDAAKRYADGIIKLGKELYDRNLTKSEFDDKVLWQLNESEFTTNSGLEMEVRGRETRFDTMNTMLDGYLLSNDWFVQGDMPAVTRQMDLLEFGESPDRDPDAAGGKKDKPLIDHGIPIRKMMADLVKRLKPKGPVVLTKYYTKLAWQENINNVEMAYANSNTTSTYLEVDIENWSGPFDLDMEVDAETGEQDYSRKFIELQPQEQAEEESADEEKEDKSDESQQSQPQFRKRLPLKKLESKPSDEEGSASPTQFLTFLQPKTLGKRNEDGYRFEVKTKRDLQKAIEVMILTSIAESFPRQMFLYTKEEGYLRILGGAYRELPKKAEANTAAR